MRHHKAKRKFHRMKGQREALIKSLARSLVLKEGITTTVAKAKELRPFVERLVSTTKKGSLTARRDVVAQIGDATPKLYKITERFGKRAGGYTRIVRLGRTGKRMIESARIEFVQ